MPPIKPRTARNITSPFTKAGMIKANNTVTRKALLEMAEKIPGAWIGIRIAALLLLFEGWKSSQIASLFGLTRWSVVRWIQGVNEKGILAEEAKKKQGD